MCDNDCVILLFISMIFPFSHAIKLWQTTVIFGMCKCGDINNVFTCLMFVIGPLSALIAECQAIELISRSDSDALSSDYYYTHRTMKLKNRSRSIILSKYLHNSWPARELVSLSGKIIVSLKINSLFLCRDAHSSSIRIHRFDRYNDSS